MATSDMKERGAAGRGYLQTIDGQQRLTTLQCLLADTRAPSSQAEPLFYCVHF